MRATIDQLLSVCQLGLLLFNYFNLSTLYLKNVSGDGIR